MCIICEGKDKFDFSDRTTIICCFKIKELPDLEECPNLQTLNCAGCTSLKELPNLNSCINLQYLYCYDCKNLKELPNLDSCINLQCLYCWGCRMLTSIPESIQTRFYPNKLPPNSFKSTKFLLHLLCSY